MAANDDEGDLSGDETEKDFTQRKNQHYEDPYDGQTTVVIENLSKKREEGGRHFTEPFLVGEFRWRLLYFPNGNDAPAFSVYIEALSDTNNYKRNTKFRMSAKNHTGGKEDVAHHANHIFTPRDKDWGFTNFLRLEDLNDPGSGFLKDDNFHIVVEVLVRKEVSTLGCVVVGVCCCGVLLWCVVVVCCCGVLLWRRFGPTFEVDFSFAKRASREGLFFSIFLFFGVQN